MSLIPVRDTEKIGIIRDLFPYRLPPNAWSDGNNMDFAREVAQKSPAWVNSFSPTITPLYLQSVESDVALLTVYLDLVSAKVWDGQGETDITRAAGAYTMTLLQRWIGTVLGGIPLFTNGVDAPQAWGPPSAAQKLINLTNWPANYLCNTLRSYLAFAVAGNIFDGSTRYRQRVLWSNPTSAGALPNSWDVTNPANQAGQTDLTDTPDSVVDFLAMPNYLVVYKEESCWAMQFSGQPFVFTFAPLFKSGLGMIAPDCAQQLDNSQHFVVTKDDVVTHNGFQMQSIITSKDRKWLFDHIDTSAQAFSFTFKLSKRSEIWFCFPLSGSQTCNVAMVWNYRYNTITFKDLPNIRSASVGVQSVASFADAWYGDLVTQWYTETSQQWYASQFATSGGSATFGTANGTADKLLTLDQMDTVFQAAGANYTSYLERQGICLLDDGQGNVTPANNIVKMLESVWPQIYGTNGDVVNVYLSSQMNPDDPVVWQGPFPFTIGTTQKIDAYLTGRFFGVRFSDDGAVQNQWRVHGYDLDIVPLSYL